ncbi:MAG: site-specific DNA-methyltransferase [Cyanobacteria bacterium P01_B01_bin.77]
MLINDHSPTYPENADTSDELKIVKSVNKEITETRIASDARRIPLIEGEADIVITSPPYWLKRDYGVDGQIGLEKDPNDYIDNLVQCMREWRRVLPNWGSVFINIGDTYHKGGLAQIPGRLEHAATNDGWVLRNRIIWAKTSGMPDPAKDRLKSRHEFILHFTQKRNGYYYDQYGYSSKYGNGTGPSDVWTIGLKPKSNKHLAPFPEELVDRIITLACPEQVCSKCGTPRTRIIERTLNLDESRPQARRALELAREGGLTKEHLLAVQATGISDVGKATKTQTGTGRNSDQVKLLAKEAKAVLGGYFREFTFAKKKSVGWSKCACKRKFRRGVVLDPFMGTGTTLAAATAAKRSSVGVDLSLEFDPSIQSHGTKK